MTGPELVVVGAAVFVAALVQVAAGFGFGLLAVPVMALAVSPREAVVVATLIGICVNGWQTYHGRREVDHALANRMSIAAYAGMPLGLWVFVAVDEDVLRLLLGGAVLVAVIVLALQVDLDHAGPGLDVAAGFVSGVLNTSLSTNGPPLVFALQARRLGPPAFRATISRIFTYSSAGALALFVAAGKVTGDGLVATAVSIPTMLVGQAVGFPLRRHLHGERFRWTVLGLMAVAALSAIASALG